MKSNSREGRIALNLFPAMEEREVNSWQGREEEGGKRFYITGGGNQPVEKRERRQEGQAHLGGRTKTQENGGGGRSE